MPPKKTEEIYSTEGFRTTPQDSLKHFKFELERAEQQGCPYDELGEGYLQDSYNWHSDHAKYIEHLTRAIIALEMYIENTVEEVN